VTASASPLLAAPYCLEHAVEYSNDVCVERSHGTAQWSKSRYYPFRVKAIEQHACRSFTSHPTCHLLVTIPLLTA
jgi:hypothetical protein